MGLRMFEEPKSCSPKLAQKTGRIVSARSSGIRYSRLDRRELSRARSTSSLHSLSSDGSQSSRAARPTRRRARDAHLYEDSARLLDSDRFGLHASGGRMTDEASILDQLGANFRSESQLLRNGGGTRLRRGGSGSMSGPRPTSRAFFESRRQDTSAAPRERDQIGMASEPAASSMMHPLSASQTATGSAAFTPGFAPAQALMVRQTAHAEQDRLVAISRLAGQIRDLWSVVDQQHVSALRTMHSALETMLRLPNVMAPEYGTIETQILSIIRERISEIVENRTVSRATLMADNGEVNDASQLQSSGWRRYLQQTQETLSGSSREINGLGDRQRSFSPDGLVFEGVLSTANPEEQVPDSQVSASFNRAETPTTSLTRVFGALNDQDHLYTNPQARSTETGVAPCPVPELLNTRRRPPFTN